MTQLSTVCSASTIKNQIILLDENDSHFDNGALRSMEDKNIQPFVLKAGDSGNDQTNDNRPNKKLKSR